ncbi:MAG: phosphate acyltransferase, partial [Methylophilaceae bacterium]
MTVTIAVDVMGGDHGAKVTVPATLSFLKTHPDVRVILVGQQPAIEQALT